MVAPARTIQRPVSLRYPALFILLLAPLSFLLSQWNFLLFHSFSELFTVLVSFGMFVIIWHCRDQIDQAYLLFLGPAYGCSGFLGLMHLLTYKGMGVFPTATANMPTQFWIGARLLESLCLFGGLFLPASSRRIVPSVIVLGMVTTGITVAILTGHFPDCYIEGQSPPLTDFKVWSEYLIIGLLLATILLLKHRTQLPKHVQKALAAALLCSIIGELAFTFYVSVYGFSNLVGHLFRVMATFFIYLAVIETGLRRPQAVLYAGLASSEQALQQTNQQLHDRNQKIQDMTTHLAHDLRAPLSVIDGYAQIMQGAPEKELLEEGVQQISTSARQMSAMLDDLLQLAKTGAQPMEPSSVDLVPLAHQAFMEAQMHHPDREGFLDAPPELPVWGDRKLLQLVLENLISNAWKYSDPQHPLRIRLAQDTENPTTFFLEDNGYGFPEEEKHRLFQPFERLHRNISTKGLGIGLTSVRQAVQRHGGRIWAENRAEDGARFLIHLPDTLNALSLNENDSLPREKTPTAPQTSP